MRFSCAIWTNRFSTADKLRGKMGLLRVIHMRSGKSLSMHKRGTIEGLGLTIAPAESTKGVLRSVRRSENILSEVQEPCWLMGTRPTVAQLYQPRSGAVLRKSKEMKADQELGLFRYDMHDLNGGEDPGCRKLFYDKVQQASAKIRIRLAMALHATSKGNLLG